MNSSPAWQKKIAKYLPPQLYRGILPERRTSRSPERKKLTVFFSDVVNFASTTPKSRGVVEDAKALPGHALNMQRRLAELNGQWQNRGIKEPLRASMGINTGFCNVGNFGSEDRMDYTIIGAEANLASRPRPIWRRVCSHSRNRGASC